MGVRHKPPPGVMEYQSMPKLINTDDPTEPTLGAMLVVGGTIEGYEDGTRRSRIADSPARGMVIHWATQLPEGTLTGTLWRERKLAEHFMADVLADAFTELVGEDRRLERSSPDYSYATLSLLRYVAGADAGFAVGRSVGSAAGAVLIRPRVEPGEQDYAAASSTLGLGEAAPEGMIAHIAASDGEHVRWIDLWLDRAAPAAFYEEAGIASETLELLPLHTVIVNADELSQLPRFPR
jgi:hypothetical protein